MKTIKIGTNRLISVVLSIVMCATILTGAIWALSNLFKTGMSIVVTYDAPVNAKVYLSTDSTGAGTLRQPSSDNIVTVGNFNKANSAIIFNMHDNDNDGAQSKTNFEALGTGDKSLICDANGEMQFYVFVENYSETDDVYYRANITFGNEGETTPFNIAENPSYAVSEAVSDSTGGGGVTSSLLAFKIALNSEFEGIPADQITIKIELSSSYLGILGVNFVRASGFYDETNTGETGDMRKNYIGLHWVEFGEYPQSLHGTTLPEGTNATPNEKGYYENPATGLKYAFKSPNYYLVEPVRWLIIGNGSGLNGKGFPDKNGNDGADLASNQLLLFSERILFNRSYSSATGIGRVRWADTELYNYLEQTVKSQIFSPTNLNMLGDFQNKKYNDSVTVYYSKLSLFIYPQLESHHFLTYCPDSNLNIRLCEFTNYAGSSANYLLRYSHELSGTNIYGVNPSNGNVSVVSMKTALGVRPIIILNV